MSRAPFIPLLVDLAGPVDGEGVERFEALVAKMGLSLAWAPNVQERSRVAVAALHLKHLGQIHADFDVDATLRVLGLQDQVAAALELRRGFAAAGLRCLVDWSLGRMEGAVGLERRAGGPWWVAEILGDDPARLDPEGLLGQGVCVAVADHPIDRDHPALVGRCLAPVEAWRLPWDDPVDVIPDDHGTGSAGLVAGWDQAAGHRLGLAPGAKILPVHLSPGPGLDRRPDLLRTLCRALDGVRTGQLDLRDGLQLAIVTQQIALTNLTFGKALMGQYDDAIAVLERAYARAAGDWGLAILASAGSHPRANWPVLPSGLAGVVSVGAVDERDLPVRRSPRFGVDLVCRVSHQGHGPVSCAAGGGYIEQGQATSAAAPLAAGALAAAMTRQGTGARRALRLLRTRGVVVQGGASRIFLGL